MNDTGIDVAPEIVGPEQPPQAGWLQGLNSRCKWIDRREMRRQERDQHQRTEHARTQERRSRRERLGRRHQTRRMRGSSHAPIASVNALSSTTPAEIRTNAPVTSG